MRLTFSKRWLLPILLSIVIAVMAAMAVSADPDDGTLSNKPGGETTLTYTGGPYFTANVSPQVGVECIPPALECDEYALTVDVTEGTAETHDIRITISWPLAAADFDVYLLDSDGNEVANAASSSNPEIIVYPPNNGTYNLVVVPFAPAAQSFEGTIELVEKQTVVDPGPIPVQFPRYHTYTPPPGLGQEAAEPSIGVNWNTNATMYIAILETLRVHFDDDYSADLIADDEIDHSICSSPVKEVWVDKSYDLHLTTLDPILFTNQNTGRTFSSQLNARTSILGLSDDDGETWLPSEGADALVSAVDHQTIGSGPYAESPLFPTPLYEEAVYYCSQDIAYANCARSDDGGLTFQTAIPIYNLTECSGLHGHVKISPTNRDGTRNPNTGYVYVPNKACGGGQGIAMSKDNGITWEVHVIPDSVTSVSDPFVGIATDGTVYVAYMNGGDRVPTVAVFDPQTETFSNNNPVAGNIPEGFGSIVFPVIAAGDPDRAVMGWLGTDQPSAFSFNTDPFAWYLYVAHTFDGGQTWHTENITPGDPVQRGSICRGGTGCSNTPNDRNLLDFNEITIDRVGRALIGYADGCITEACINNTKSPANDYTELASIARLEGGLRLFADFDGITNTATVPAAPRVDSVTQEGTGSVTLDWTIADDGGSDITGFNVYRSDLSAGPYVKLNAVMPVTKNSYVDTSVLPDTNYFYKVTALNAVGEGPSCEVYSLDGSGSPTEPPNACISPGIIAASDAVDDNTTSALRDDTDLLSVQISEPYNESDPDSDLILITTNVADLSLPSPAAQTAWYTRWTFDGTGYYVGMQMDPNGISVSYEYGTYVLDGGTLFDNTSLGEPDVASFSEDGSIIIGISKSKLSASGEVPAAGDSFTNLDAIVFTGAGLQLSDDTITTPGSYTLVGNQSCAPNNEPMAVLEVTPREGDSPLTVSIDASGSSDPDSGDTIAQYEFDLGLGDGTPNVITTSATIQHTYSHTNSQTTEYRISVTVTDSRGLRSPSSDARVIEVNPEGGIPTALFTSQIGVDSNRIGALVGIVVILSLTVAVVFTTARVRRKLK